MSTKRRVRNKVRKLDVTKPKLDLGAMLVESLKQAIDGLNGVGKKITVRTYEIPEPRKFTARQVKGVRTKLGLSQASFAKLVGVSKKLVEAWEGGTRVPSTMACRLLEAIHREPFKYVRVTGDVLPRSGEMRARVVKKRVA